MIKKVCLADKIPYQFPFIAEMQGTATDYKRFDQLVTVLGYSGMERHYLRVKTAGGQVMIANDSKLFVQVV